MSSSQFSQTILSGCSFSTSSIVFTYLNDSEISIVFSVSKKYGNAVKRNLFKRRCKYIFNSLFNNSDYLISVVVKPKTSNVSFKTILKSFSSLHKHVNS